MENKKEVAVPQAKVEDLVKSVLDGTATESESGLVARTLQMAVSGALVTGMSQMLSSLGEYDDLVNKVREKYKAKIEEQIEIMSLDDMQKVLDGLDHKRIQILDLYRKVAQGKELFPTDIISEEEKKVLKLLKSFKSEADKKKFIELCEQTFAKPQDSNDFEED